MTTPTTTLTLHHWRDARNLPARLQEGWSLMLDGRAVITRDTEAAARAEAERHGWTIERVVNEGEAS